MTDTPLRVHLADGFDRPERIAFGLEAPQLACVALASLLAWWLLHAPLAAPLPAAAAALVGLAGAVLGWGRWAQRSLLSWVWLAARHHVGPQRARTHDRTVVGVSAAAGGRLDDDHSPRTGNAAPGWVADDTRAAPPPAIVDGTAGRLPRYVPHAAGGSPASPPPPRHAGDLHHPARSRRTAVWSVAGGVGRTTIATELAVLRASQGAQVALLDLDTRNPAVDVRTGLVDPTLTDWLARGSSRHAVGEHLALHRSGLRVLLGPPDPAVARHLTPASGAELLLGIERLGVRDVVVDLAAGDLGAVASWLLATADVVLVVLSARPAGIHSAYRALAALRRLGATGDLALVCSRAPGAAAPHTVRRALAEVVGDLGAPLVGVIPDDPELDAAEDRHAPAVLGGDGPAVRALRDLAARLDIARGAAADARVPEASSRR